MRGRSFDRATEQGRSAERYRRVALTAGSSVAARAVTACAGIISVPLTIGYLGVERYGLWMAISSVVGMLAFADLGIGNGLLNAVSSAVDDRPRAQRAVSSAFAMLCVAGAAVAGLALAAYPLVPWNRLFNVTSSPAVVEAGPAALVLILCFAVNLPLGTVERVQAGFQEGFRNNLWQCAAAVAGLGAVIVAIRLHAGLPWLVAALAAAPTVVRLANWLVQFTAIRPWLRPRLRLADRETAGRLSKTGLVFLGLNLFMLLGYWADSLIITQAIGPAAVARYAVVQKLFYGTHISEYLIAPLWPAFGEALARGDHSWVRRAIGRSLKLNLLLTLATSIPLLVFGSELVRYWTVSKVAVGFPVLLAFAAARLLSVYRATFSAFLNHDALIRRQFRFFAAASLVSFALKLLLVRPLGEAGVLWATVLGFALFYVRPAARLAFSYLDRNY